MRSREISRYFRVMRFEETLNCNVLILIKLSSLVGRHFRFNQCHWNSWEVSESNQNHSRVQTLCLYRLELYRVISEYFLGLWAEGKSKDYVDRKGNEGTSDRLVPAMPYQHKSTTEGQTQFNLRKMAELPHALTLAADVDGLKEHVFLNFDYLYYKVKALSADR